MPATIHCIRHAQGFHNLGAQFHHLPDPKLTPVGLEQCKTLKQTRWPPSQTQNISLVTCSPLSRTINTAYAVFSDFLASSPDTKFLAIPDAQETSDFPCDHGSDLSVLKGICREQGWPVDLSLLDDDWNVKIVGARYSPASHAVKARARDARRLLREKAREFEAEGNENSEIVLVTHGGYLHYFTEDWEGSNRLLGTGWENCETRSYVFEAGDGEEDEDARLVETMESRKSRGLEHPMFPKDEQMKLFNDSMQQWKDQGLQDSALYDEAPADKPEESPMTRKTEVEVAA